MLLIHATDKKYDSLKFSHSSKWGVGHSFIRDQISYKAISEDDLENQLAKDPIEGYCYFDTSLESNNHIFKVWAPTTKTERCICFTRIEDMTQESKDEDILQRLREMGQNQWGKSLWIIDDDKLLKLMAEEIDESFNGYSSEKYYAAHLVPVNYTEKICKLEGETILSPRIPKTKSEIAHILAGSLFCNRTVIYGYEPSMAPQVGNTRDGGSVLNAVYKHTRHKSQNESRFRLFINPEAFSEEYKNINDIYVNKRNYGRDIQNTQS